MWSSLIEKTGRLLWLLCTYSNYVAKAQLDILIPMFPSPMLNAPACSDLVIDLIGGSIGRKINRDPKFNMKDPVEKIKDLIVLPDETYCMMLSHIYKWHLIKLKLSASTTKQWRNAQDWVLITSLCIKFVSLLLITTCFHYTRKLHKQKFGAAIGGLCLSCLANLYH